MSPVDNFAAKALDVIEADVEKTWNDAERRSAWSLFLMSLMMRMPEDVVALTQIEEDKWKLELPGLRQKYAATRKPDDPETIEEFIEKKDPEYIGRWVMDDLPELTHHEGVGQALSADEPRNYNGVPLRSAKPAVERREPKYQWPIVNCPART